MRRWTRRILLGLLVVIVLAVVTTQVVLWTDFPRRLVLKLVQQQLGLRVEAASLSTGWFGSTTLKEVKVSLPLADESFLAMPTMEVDHTALLPLAVTQKFDLEGIKLVKPILVVRRDANGRWTLQDVAELLAKAGGGNAPAASGAASTKKKPPKLPRFRLIDGVVTVIERDGRKAVIEPLNVTGDPRDALVYQYDAEIPQRLKALGQVAPGENWKHEVAVFAEPDAEWLKPWLQNVPQPLTASVRWNGSVEDGRVSGRLNIEQAKYQTYSAHGTARVTAGGATTVVTPQNLVVATSMPAVPEVQLASGTLRVEGTRVRAEQVRVSARGGSAQLDGSGDLATKSADLRAEWVELPAPGDIKHSGTLTAQLRTPFPGGPEFAATLVTRGQAPKGRWDGRINVNGAGRAWNDMQWTATAQRIAWEAKQPIEVKDFTARFANRDKLITLRGVEWPAHVVSANGRYNFDDRTWLVRLTGRSAPDARVTAAARTPVSLDIDARGDRERANLSHLLLRAQDLDVRASGAYVFNVPKPVDLSFDVTHAPRAAAAAATGEDQPPVRGRLLVQGKVSGTAAPVNLAVAGSIHARDLFVFGREYGDIKGTMTGSVLGDTAQFAVRDLKLLGGAWRLDALYPYEGSERLTTAGAADAGLLRVQVVSDGLKLADVGELLRTPLAGGDARGEWIVDVPLPGARADTVAMSGSFAAAKVVVGRGLEKFVADDVTGQTKLQDGIFRADPIQFRRAERDVKGQATVALQLNLADARRPTVTLDATTWPVPVTPDALAAVSATANLLVDTDLKTATGPITARAAVATTQETVGEASVDAHMDGRVALLNKVILDGVGGHAEGGGTIDTADPNRSKLAMSWTGVAGGRIAELLPKLKGLGGAYNGMLSIAPAGSPRAVEPLRLTLSITPQAGTFNACEIGPMRFEAFANLREDFSLERLVLDELPTEIRTAATREAELDRTGVALADRPVIGNDIRIAGGRVRVWARRGRHPAADAVQTHLILNFKDLDVDQLVHAVKPDAEPMPSRISGSVTLHGNAYNPDTIFGQGHVDLADSDLAKVDALNLLYSLTGGLGKSTTRPIGKGSLDLSLQASTLSLQNIRYFNRGVEARASSIDISDIWATPKSKMFGYIVGSVRPLKDTKLPILADFDAVLDATTSGLTTVKVEGTIEDPQVKESAFSEAGDALKRFIVGEVNTEVRAKQ
jgi:hypothetical protein